MDHKYVCKLCGNQTIFFDCVCAFCSEKAPVGVVDDRLKAQRMADEVVCSSWLPLALEMLATGEYTRERFWRELVVSIEAAKQRQERAYA